MPLPLPTEIVVCVLESFVAFPDVMDTKCATLCTILRWFLAVERHKTVHPIFIIAGPRLQTMEYYLYPHLVSMFGRR
jgi:hypothetical protein